MRFKVTAEFDSMDSIRWDFDTDDHGLFLPLCPTSEEVRKYIYDTMSKCSPIINVTVEEIENDL